MVSPVCQANTFDSGNSERFAVNKRELVKHRLSGNQKALNKHLWLYVL